MAKTRATIRFPFKGVDGAAPLSAMPEGACPDILNMYPYAPSRSVISPTDVAANRAVGSKRPGLSAGPLQTVTGRSAVGIKIWTTIYRPAANNSVDPITLLIMFDSSSGVNIAQIVDGAAANYDAVFALPSSPVPMVRPTFAPLGVRLYFVGPVKADKSANAYYLSAYEIGQSSNGRPTSATAWSINSVVPGANLCCTYRARAVIAASGESLWVMSKVGDATSWTEDPLDKNSAYRGNSTGVAGVPGDGITALIPFGDEYLIFGATSSIWMLNGDPRNGGRVVELTRKVGVYNSVSWCFDSRGTLWFLGSDYGLYRLAKGERSPVEVLKGRCAHLLRDIIPFAANARTAYLEYDQRREAVMIMVTTTALSSSLALKSVVYFTELDAPFPILFGAGGSHNCMAVADWGDIYVGFYNAAPGNNLATKIMYLIAPSYQDAGTNFQCYVKFAPIAPEDDTEWTAKRLTAVGSMNGGAVTWYWLTARSADELAQITYTSGYAATGTFFTTSGYQAPVGLRQTAACHQLVIDQTANAALRLEHFGVELEEASIQRYGV